MHLRFLRFNTICIIITLLYEEASVRRRVCSELCPGSFRDAARTWFMLNVSVDRFVTCRLSYVPRH